MSDSPRAGSPRVLNDPFAQLSGALAGTTRMRLEVVDNHRLTPAMQRVVLTAPELATFAYRPGQDMMLMVGVEGDRPVRRRYTIQALGPGRPLLTLGIVRHDDGPGERWVRAARPGDQIEGIGPRGKIFPAQDADWHLFAGDFAALPAFFAMAGSLPHGVRATVILEVPGPDDEQSLASAADADLIWLHRLGRSLGDASALVGAVTAVPLPPGPGHAYLAGEAKVVLALREALAERGLAADQISAKAYWGLGKANALHGEPAKELIHNADTPPPAVRARPGQSAGSTAAAGPTAAAAPAA
ncbi:MAG TPA: siderophore-interacting protein [Streptosporangiaceae bacterium]